MSGGYFLNSLINNAIPFLLLPILTKYLAPGDYANITLFTAYVAIFNAIIGAGLNSLIAKYFFISELKIVACLIGNIIIILAIFSISTVLLMSINYKYIANTTALPLTWFLLIPINSFTYLVFQLVLGVIRNEKKVFSFSLHQIGNSFLNFFISLMFIVLLAYNWQGRVLGIILSNIISASLAINYLYKNNYIYMSFNISIAKEVLRFVVALIPNSLQLVLVPRIGIFFIQFYFSKTLLGIYSIGYQIAYVVMIIIITLKLSWEPFFFEELNKNEEPKNILVVRMFYLHLFVIIVSVVFVNIFDNLIIKFMTNPEYYSAHDVVFWLTVGMFFNGFNLLIQPFFIHRNEEVFLGKMSFLNLIMMVIINYFSIKYWKYEGVPIAYFLTHFTLSLGFICKISMSSNLPWLSAFLVKK